MEVTILPTTDGPHPTTTSLSLTTYLALNVCVALHHRSLCEARDVKVEDRWVFWTPGLFSGGQSTAEMCLELRKQKLSANALDGLCLLCKEHMQRTWQEGGHAGTLWAHDQKATGLDYIHMCRFSPHRRWQYTFYSIPLMLRKGGMVWALVICSLNFRRW